MADNNIIMGAEYATSGETSYQSMTPAIQKVYCQVPDYLNKLGEISDYCSNNGLKFINLSGNKEILPQAFKEVNEGTALLVVNGNWSLHTLKQDYFFTQKKKPLLNEAKVIIAQREDKLFETLDKLIKKQEQPLTH